MADFDEDSLVNSMEKSLKGRLFALPADDHNNHNMTGVHNQCLIVIMQSICVTVIFKEHVSRWTLLHSYLLHLSCAPSSGSQTGVHIPWGYER